jgi:hypothetical protein
MPQSEKVRLSAGREDRQSRRCVRRRELDLYGPKLLTTPIQRDRHAAARQARHAPMR